MKELENLKRSKKAIEEFIKNLANNDSIDFERLMDEMSTCPCLELSVVNNLFDGINDQMLENLNMNNNKYVGLWFRDYQQGHGIMYYYNGDKYEGNWDQYKRSGR